MEEHFSGSGMTTLYKLILSGDERALARLRMLIQERADGPSLQQPLNCESDHRQFFQDAGRVIRDVWMEALRTDDPQRFSLLPNRISDSHIPTSPFKDDAATLKTIVDALARLDEIDQQKADVVNLRYFAGMSTRYVAAALGLSERTVRNDWSFARAWLHRELTRDRRDISVTR